MGRGKRRAAAVCRAGSAAGTEAEAGSHKSHLQHIALQSENLTREVGICLADAYRVIKCLNALSGLKIVKSRQLGIGLKIKPCVRI